MFTIKAFGSCGKERAGELVLRRGRVETPVFMPVGTKGMVKTLSASELHELGYKVMLANTYHLYLRPGVSVIEKFGGLHNFVRWNANILTDSGGFQGFSLSRLSKIEDEGILFRSHIDGSKHLFSPEKVLSIQETLGSEIVMPIDVCLGKDASYESACLANKRTIKWAAKSKEISEDKDYILMGITQGHFYEKLRKESIEEIVALDFKGYAIGGLSVGEDKELSMEMIDLSTDLLPKDKVRYLMGVGKPSDIIRAVGYGIDMFDCVYPTRIARNGSVFTNRGMLILGNSANTASVLPIDDECGCFVCANYSRAYLRHLFKAGEVLALRLATYHNLYFISGFMKRIRASILAGSFKEFKKEQLSYFN